MWNQRAGTLVPLLKHRDEVNSHTCTNRQSRGGRERERAQAKRKRKTGRGEPGQEDQETIICGPSSETVFSFA